ncbi:MAG TPA: glycosyltransferase family A protein [Streptosporangiaceae bacterium]|nr:glycosyltransferase family A protein [Streptosporangiaceae bacterium]
MTGLLISVITPTYNRAGTLRDTFGSLCDQHVPLEWIVVDDGSTDDTARLIGDLAAGSPFPVYYLRQDHTGAWAAMNRGVAAARGEMTALLGSDDMLMPHALERLTARWAAIGDQARYAGVTGLCVDEAGRAVGDRFPADIVDATWQEMHYRYRPGGEKWGFLRTDTLRDHPFPAGQGFEAVVWRSIGRRYRTRYVNDVFRVYRTSGAGHLSQVPFALCADSAASYCADMLNEDTRWLRHAPAAFLKGAALYTRGKLHQRVPVHAHTTGLHSWPARTLWAVALPLGWLLYRRDLRHGAAARH